MYRPLFFSAAQSEAFERARRQSQERAEREQRTLFWRRGFHLDENRVGWGYYLEAPSTATSSTIDEQESGEEGEDDERQQEDRCEEEAGAPGAEDRASPHSPMARWARMIPSHATRLAQAISRRTTMAVKTHVWVSLWFALTIPVIFWDAGYCFLRPRSMVGGDLHWIWKPYALYQEVDYVYGVRAYQNGDGFTNAQSALNIVENFMNIAYLYLAHVSGSPAAPLVGFASAVMTLSKTVLYWLQEFYCGGCAVGHNDLKTLIVYWIIPNGLWLVVPSFIIWQLTKDITGMLRVADRVAMKAASGKKQ
ncbi:hypothetical protein VTO73DRAFT_7100 [Trametes versicolor]